MSTTSRLGEMDRVDIGLSNISTKILGFFNSTHTARQQLFISYTGK